MLIFNFSEHNEYRTFLSMHNVEIFRGNLHNNTRHTFLKFSKFFQDAKLQNGVNTEVVQFVKIKLVKKS